MSAPIQRGELYWLAPDATGGEQGSLPGHPHPHLVVQDDVFNQSRIHTVIVAGVRPSSGS